ncbi:MAG: mechanosensitive ion channel [Bacilli bacterium]|nr:mechanosensitive ion channel [Bacilli bacterium]MBP3635569.1 mechanosensitive ion channel [Bacilli bacterium]
MNIFGIEISEKIYLPIFIIICALILDLIINIVLNNKIKISKNLTKHEQRSRETVLILIKNIIKFLIIVIVILSIMQILGVDTSALVAGATAISLVIGLAFQDILKDFLVGVAIIMESQFAIGEIVEINGFKGEVISLNLKTTRLKSYTGEVRIISNRAISEVTNYSLCDVIVKIIVSVSYEDDIKRTEKVLEKLASELSESITELKGGININGIDSLSSSSVDFLITTKTSIKNEQIVKRKMLREIKLAFDKENIKIPYPQVEVHYEK